MSTTTSTKPAATKSLKQQVFDSVVKAIGPVLGEVAQAQEKHLQRELAKRDARIAALEKKLSKLLD